MIAVPSYDGKVSVQFADALMQSMILMPDVKLEFAAVVGDAVLIKARNELFAMAYHSGMDDLVFIDSDIVWSAPGLKALLDSPADVVGGSYPIKTDDMYPVVKFGGKLVVNVDTGLAEVSALGCGFLRISQKAIRGLWELSEKYQSSGMEVAAVFAFTITPEGIVPEDVGMCRKWRNRGGKVCLQIDADCSHIGTKVYVQDTEKYFSRLGLMARTLPKEKP